MAKNRVKVVALIAALMAAAALAGCFLAGRNTGLSHRDGAKSIAVNITEFDGSPPPDEGYISIRSESFMTAERQSERNSVKIFDTFRSLKTYIANLDYNPSGNQRLGSVYPTQTPNVAVIRLQSDLFQNPGAVYVDYACKSSDSSIYVKLQNMDIKDERFYQKPLVESPYTEMLIYFDAEDLAGIETITFQVAKA